MSVRLGSQPTVILSSYEAIEQAFIKQPIVFNGRYTTFFTKVATENAGIIFLDDLPKWNLHRRFGLKALGGGGQLGYSVEMIVREEVAQLCDKIKEKVNQPFVLEKDLFLAIANVIGVLTVGEKPTETKHEALREKFLEAITTLRDDNFAYMMMAVLPWSRFIPPISKNFKHMLGTRDRSNECLYQIIDDHASDIEVKHPRDLVDLYLTEILDKKQGYTRKHLQHNVADLHVAGTETSTSTIRWALLFLVKYPEVQEKVHQEIDDIVGKEGKISLHAELHYTRAVIQEVYRIEAVVPLSVPRRTTKDITFMGYKIPKDTQIIPNIWKVHNDPAVWKNPEQFQPERHLDSEGKFVKLNQVIPFSIGQRNCMGENLARMEVFLFVVTILQKFQLCPDPQDPVPKLGALFGVFHSPEHYRIVFRQR
uniref:Cytochrome P450 2J2-like n=1 Tax=Phallusia mammillata TaxID=59560 RepID=A0A6F9DAX4_9ASCI|nr:cytochrome P450 2J2-like [Phallusia mammillata]